MSTIKFKPIPKELLSLSASKSTSSIKQSAKQQEQLNPKKYRALIYILNRLILKRSHHAFNIVRIRPSKLIKVQRRMAQIVIGLYRKQDYVEKWNSFQKVRRRGIEEEKVEVKAMEKCIKELKVKAMSIVNIFVKAKKKCNFHFVISQIKKGYYLNIQKTKTNYRKAFRILSVIFQKKYQFCFHKIRSSTYIFQRNLRLRNMLRIANGHRQRLIKKIFVKLHRHMLIEKKSKLKQQIGGLQGKLSSGEDEQTTELKKRQQDLLKQLDQTRKEKEDAIAEFEQTMREAEEKNKEMHSKIQELKQIQSSYKQKIVEADQKLRQPYSIPEIYQLCYNNLLYYLSTRQNQKTYPKSEILKALETPLLPVDIPQEELKEENQILSELLSQYIIMYGDKKIEQGFLKVELPYQFLVKQNQMFYKIMSCLLENVPFLKEEVYRVREAMNGITNTLKELGYK